MLKPNLINVIVDVPVTVDCYASGGNGYSSLAFTFFPASGLTHQDSLDKKLHDGGISKSTTFTMTAGLNGTINITCYAFDTEDVITESQPATIYAQEVPNYIDNFRYCKLLDRLFIYWSPVITLNSIVIEYEITDNHENKTINVSHYSVSPSSGLYQANIVVIVNATVANQIAYGEQIPKEIIGM